MASRIYDIELECGCLLSADGGGGCIPCGASYYDPTYTPTQADYDLETKCSAAWAKFRKSGEMARFDLECERRNS